MGRDIYSYVSLGVVTAMVNLSTKKQSFKFRITGISETLRKLNLLEDGIIDEVDDLLEEFTNEYLKEIKDSAPYDTGRYWTNWDYQKEKVGKFIISNTYANVADPNTGVHYGDILVYGISKFKGIAGNKAKYRYGNPATGALHDLGILGVTMQPRFESKFRKFTLRKIKGV